MPKRKSYNILEHYDVSYETPFTTENYDEIEAVVMSGPVNQVLNKTFRDVLGYALVLGLWDPAKQPLGEYEKESVKMMAGSFPSKKKQFQAWLEPDIVEMLNKFGERYVKDEEIPLLVLRDKKTGEIESTPYSKMTPKDEDKISKILEKHQDNV